MTDYIGHIITAIGLVVTVAIGFGVMKANIDRNRRDTADQEARLRSVEMAKNAWDTHVSNAAGVLERLRVIETDIATIKASLQQRAENDRQLMDILEANRMVLGELGTEIAVLKALRDK